MERIKNVAAYVESKIGINPLEVDQGSDEWFKLKLGVISASNIEYILAKKGGVGRTTYVCKLIAQIGTQEMPEVSAKAMEWGKEHEQEARSAYAFVTGNEVNEVAFIFKDEFMRAGASPDGLIYSVKRGLELKVPFTSAVHAQFICCEKIKKEYILQCQFGMWCTGFDTWDFCSFDPRFLSQMLKVKTIERDEKTMNIFDEKVPEFIEEMDEMLKVAGIKWGSQWK